MTPQSSVSRAGGGEAQISLDGIQIETDIGRWIGGSFPTCTRQYDTRPIPYPGTSLAAEKAARYAAE